MKATMNKRIETNISLSNSLYSMISKEANVKPLYNRCCVNEAINGHCSEAFKSCMFLHKNTFFSYYYNIFEKFNIPILDDNDYLQLCKKFSKTIDENEKKVLGLEVEKQGFELYNKQQCIYWADPKGEAKRPEFSVILHRFSTSILYYKDWPI